MVWNRWHTVWNRLSKGLSSTSASAARLSSATAFSTAAAPMDAP